jgi:PHD/YefM family antitoxin component YafN of YafNO toxin-antitoxin module
MKSVVHRIPITRARINLGQVVRRVHVHREYFILEKDGIPVAGIMSADELEDHLDLKNPELKKHIQKGKRDFRRGKGREVSEFLAELKDSAAKAKK